MNLLPPWSKVAMCAASIVAVTGATSSSTAAVLPYSNNFSTTGFESSNNGFSLNGGTYRVLVGTGAQASGATNSFSGTNDIDGKSFTTEVKFRIDQVGNYNNTIGTIQLSIFGDTANNTSGNYYMAQYAYAGIVDAPATTPGQLSFSGVGTGASGTNAITPGTPTNVGVVITGENNPAGDPDLATTWYTLRLNATYNAGSYNLQLSLLDATGLNQIGGSATATIANPLSGNHFGIRQRTNTANLGGPPEVDVNEIRFDDYSLSVVPEPSITMLSLVGLVAMVTARRRRNR